MTVERPADGGAILVYAAAALVIVALYQDEIARLVRRVWAALPRPRSLGRHPLIDREFQQGG